MTDSKKTSVYIVEDSAVTRSVIREMLTVDPNITVVGETDDGETAVKEVLALKPQVTIIDIGLSGVDGIQVLKLVKAQIPDLRVIMLTADENDNSMFEAFSAGAAAYLLKTEFDPKKLVKAISDVQTDSAWFDPTISKQFLKSAATQDSAKLAKLSPEEKRILQLVAEQSEPVTAPSVKSETGVLDKLESEGPAGDWNSFLKKLARFKE